MEGLVICCGAPREIHSSAVVTHLGFTAKTFTLAAYSLTL